MISPSEGALEGSISTRMVLPLEFHALEELAAGGISDAVVELPVESERAMKDNLAAIHLKLTRDELKSLDEASQLAPEYPQWMLAIQGADRLGPVDL